jgi:hypothetical protein
VHLPIAFTHTFAFCNFSENPDYYIYIPLARSVSSAAWTKSPPRLRFSRKSPD